MSSEIVKCGGIRLGLEPVAVCPDKALLSRACASRNILPGQPSLLCFKCAEKEMLDMHCEP